MLQDRDREGRCGTCRGLGGIKRTGTAASCLWPLPGVHLPARSCCHSTGPTAAGNTSQGLHLKRIFILLFSSISFLLCFLKVKYMTDWKFTKLAPSLRTFEMCVLIPPLSRCSRWKPLPIPTDYSRGVRWVDSLWAGSLIQCHHQHLINRSETENVRVHCM